MSGKGLDFEAGSDFTTSPMDAIQANMSQSVEATPAAPVEGGTESTQPETTERSWADPDPREETSEVTDGSREPSTDGGPYLEIKGADGEVKRVPLDPDNEDLKRIVGKGTAADKWRIERDRAKSQIQKMAKELETLRAQAEKARKVDDLEELRSLGHTSAAARVALGDEGFKAFVEEVREALNVELSGDPDEIRDYEKKVSDRERELADRQRTKTEQELRRQLEEIEERGHLSRYRAAASADLAKHDFNKYVEDPADAERLNQKVWRLAASDLKDYAAARGLGPDQISEQMIHKAVARNAADIRCGRIAIADQRANSIIEKKKQEAKENAQIVATSRYPQGQATVRNDAISDWMNSGSRSSKDLLRRLVKGN